MRVQRTEPEDRPEEDVAHRAQVSICKLVLGKYLD